MPKAAPKHRPFGPSGKRHCPPEISRQARRAHATNSATWRAIRSAKLAMNPLCECCEKGSCPRCARSKVRAANQVDHKDGDASNDAPENHQSMCAPCHGYKTAKFDGGFGNRQGNR